jgi:8-oxo-dGTP diphosphatase
MKDRKEKIRVPILAAGGVVLRNDDDNMRFAVVQSRKLATWGLPKGKLAAGEDAVTAARREVLEETGHHVTVHEFLGTLVYETSGSSRPKVVQFWRMEAAGPPAATLMRDIMAVDWLGLEDAINRLSHMRERVFLEQVGSIALELAERSAADALFPGHDAGRILVPGVPLAPADDASLSDGAVEWGVKERAGSRPFEYDFTARHVPAADVAAPAGLNAQDRPLEAAGTEVPRPIDPPALRTSVAERGLSEWSLSELSLGGKILMKKTWGWFRHAATLHRQPLD